MNIENANYEELLAENKRLHELLEESRNVIAVSIVLAFALQRITLVSTQMTVSYMTRINNKISAELNN